MLQAFVVTLREGLEAFLIVAISLSYLRKTGRQALVPAVYWGITGSILLSIAAGVALARAANQALWEGVLARIPVVNSIYTGVKQVSDTLFAPGGQAFRKALLVQWPSPGTWTIAFLTGTPGGDVARHLKGDYVSIYVPTTPNPTGGYFVMLPRDAVIELDMTVDEALKYIISTGVAAPGSGARRSGPVVPPSAKQPRAVNQ